MYKSVLRYLRSLKCINIPIRWLLKKAIGFSYHWRISGIINVQFEGRKFKLFTLCDDALADIFYYNRDYFEQYDLKLFLSLCKGKKVIFDVGANIGLYSILAAKENSVDETEIYAFEPYIINFKRLIRNCEINSCTIKQNPCALGDHNGIINFSVPVKDQISESASADHYYAEHSFRGEKKWKQIEVAQLTMDEYAKDNLHGQIIDLVKIDVEGYEMQVFSGMKIILSQHRPVILFECIVTEEREKFFNDLIKENRYHLYAIFSAGAVKIDCMKRSGNLNFLMVPDEMEIKLPA